MNTEFAYTQKKILFACIPAEGHFNPLTGLAKHLQSEGYDVRWYTSDEYKGKLEKLQIPHYGFTKAMNIPSDKIDEVFPERKKIKSLVKKLNFDIENYFVRRGPEFYEDIKMINRHFDFDLLIADVAFTGIPFVKDLLHKPVIAVGVFPLVETSKDLPPNGLGMEPSDTVTGRIKQALLRFTAQKILFRKCNRICHQILKAYGVKTNNEFLFDLVAHKADLLLQSGTPAFEYKRSDLSRNVRFIGALLPYSNSENKNDCWFDTRLNEYERVILLTQGTVERDPGKIIIPTLEAFKNSHVLVVCTTGGSHTKELKRKYPQHNIIIEDFIPFDDVMPYADVYITNGGYGGVMLGIENKLPMVVAGVHEGKNEICARIGYFKYGINLKTETPVPSQIKAAVNEVFTNGVYKKNVERLSNEFAAYSPNQLCAVYAASLLGKNRYQGKFINERAW